MDSNATAGVDRLRGLLNWWGVTGNAGEAAPDLYRFASAVTAMQKAYLDAVERHLDTVFASNDRITRAAHGLLALRDANQFVDAQAELVNALSQAAADYATAWTELNRSVQSLVVEAAPVPAETAMREEAVKVERAAPAPRPATERAARMPPVTQGTGAAA